MLQAEIAAVNGQIQHAEVESQEADEIGNRDYWREEKAQLRQEKAQLRQKEAQLRQKEAQLRQDKAQLTAQMTGSFVYILWLIDFVVSNVCLISRHWLLP